jgi:trehalose/maltose hydrolase-like predicted phosphorylase
MTDSWPSQHSPALSVPEPRQEGEGDPDWTYHFPDYLPEDEGHREALGTLGNGVFAVRAHALEGARGPGRYGGTYAAGFYNRTTSTIEGSTVIVEALANLPTWLPVRCRINDENQDRIRSGEAAWLHPGTCRLLEHRQEIDMRHGLLHRSYRLQDDAGRRTAFRETRLVHMEHPHLAAVQLRVTAENWHGTLRIHSALDGSTTNHQIDRYQAFDGRHLTAHATGAQNNVIWLTCQSTSTNITLALAARTTCTTEGSTAPASSVREAPTRSATRTQVEFTAVLTPGRSAVVEKTAALRLTRRRTTEHLRRRVVSEAAEAPPFSALAQQQSRAWELLWAQMPDHDAPALRRNLRLYRFHLLQVMSPHSAVLDAGVPSRGLSGEEYHGRVFWDEMPVITWLSHHFPATARAALDYRHRRLPAALRLAAEHGERGARYPWQSADDGRETTVPLVFNPLNQRWTTDHSARQRHVSLSLAHTLFTYAELTRDTAYLHGPAAEMILQIARNWAHLARYDPEEQRFHIDGVMGPDEYHDGYPDRIHDQPGLSDNAYTNILASDILTRAGTLWHALPDSRRQHLNETCGFTQEETLLWDRVARRLHVPFHDGVLSQFAGWENLQPLDLDRCRARHGDDLRRLDRLLPTHGDHPRNYQVSKQADTLMLGYLFSPTQLITILDHLGYRLTADAWRRTVDYYLDRTTHGSTLSAPVHAHVLAAINHPRAGTFYHQATAVDITTVDNTASGIHLGAMAAALNLTPPLHRP